MKVTFDHPTVYPTIRRRHEVPAGHFYTHLDLASLRRLALQEESPQLVPLDLLGHPKFRSLDLQDGRVTSCRGSTVVMDHGPFTTYPR